MKQILILILIVILFIFGYNTYSDYKRFHSPGVDYVHNEKVDLNYHDKNFLLNYYQAIEDLNGYVRMQWVAKNIDVRTPEKDNQDTRIAVLGYTKKLGTVKFYENKLVASSMLKNQGFNNEDVLFFEQNGLNVKNSENYLKNRFLKETLKSNPEKYSLKLGDYNSFVFEIQKILVANGYDIPVDGIFKDITFRAIQSFEEKNGLLPDGKMDILTLEYLLK